MGEHNRIDALAGPRRLFFGAHYEVSPGRPYPANHEPSESAKQKLFETKQKIEQLKSVGEVAVLTQIDAPPEIILGFPDTPDPGSLKETAVSVKEEK